MKHLILGSKGQVGTYVAETARAAGDEVIDWDIVMGKQYDLTDTYNLPDLERAIVESDFVHFLAYDVGGSTYLAKYQQTYEFVQNNIQMMENVFGILKRTNKPFYFASSQMSNMYSSVYGRLKAVGEAYTAALPNGYNVQFWNVYGYETDPDKTHVITDFIRMALNEGRILIRTNGDEQRNFLYGADAAVMLLNLANTIVGTDENEKLVLEHALIRWNNIVPICSRMHNTVTVNRLARIISEAVSGNVNGIPIYRTDKKDTTQVIFNEPPEYGSWQESLLLRGKSFTAIEDGIKKLVEIEKKNVTK